MTFGRTRIHLTLSKFIWKVKDNLNKKSFQSITYVIGYHHHFDMLAGYGWWSLAMAQSLFFLCEQPTTANKSVGSLVVLRFLLGLRYFIV